MPEVFATDIGDPAPFTKALASTEITVMVVAGHALVRAGLRAVLCEHPGLSVIAEAGDAVAAVGTAARVRPDVVLLDEPPRDLAAQRAVSTLRRSLPGACVLYLARHTPPVIGDVFSVPSDAGVDELRSVLGAVLGERCGACLLRPQCPAPRVAVALSRREQQVAVHVADGLSSKQIAAALGIGLRTVNTYRESLARKLGASSAAVVTRFVLEQKLTSPPADPAL